MPLPSSPPITMGNVKTELSLSGTLTLNDSRVHTLFGVSGNPIRLLQGLGKSNGYGYRASSYALTSGTGTGFSNPSYCWDGTVGSTTVETSTAGNLYATNTNGYRTASGYITGFGSGTKSGILKVYYTLSIVDVYESGQGYADIGYTVNGTYHQIDSIANDYNLGSSTSGTTNISLSSIDLSTLYINASTTAGRQVPDVSYRGNVYIYDAVFIA